MSSKKLSSNSQQDSGSSSPQPSPSPSPAPAPTPVGDEADGIPAGFPNSTNTGYLKAPDYPGNLTDCSGLTFQSNHVYKFCDFKGGAVLGSKTNPVTNVTIYGSRFHGSGDGALAIVYGDNVTFDYDTFEPDVSLPPVSYSQGYQYGIEADGGWYSFVQQLTVTHTNIWGFANGIDVAGSTQAKPHIFRDNWIHDARADGGVDHTDGLGEQSGGSNNSYVTIDHNSIVSAGNTQGIAYQGSSYSHFSVTNNYLSGFGYTVCIGSSGSNISIVGNTFGTNVKPDWGLIYAWSSGNNNIWKCNKWHVVSGSYYTPISDDGKFATPDGPSTTDYMGNTSCP